MRIEDVEESGDALHFTLADSNEAVANTIRRTILSRVETCSVETISVVANQSGLFDEIIANRIGQIPLEIPDRLDEDEEATLFLDEEGPKTVTASDMTPGEYDVSPVEDVVIVDLKEGQRIELEARAQMSSGKEHAKHQGGTAGYEKVGEGDYRFRVESTSAYSNKELVRESVNTVESELRQVKKQMA